MPDKRKGKNKRKAKSSGKSLAERQTEAIAALGARKGEYNRRLLAAKTEGQEQNESSEQIAERIKAVDREFGIPTE